MQGLVLEGGGARGAYQVGAIKALYELGYEFDGVSGTSIGAINGAFVALDEIEELEKLWSNLEYDEFINIDPEDYKLIKDMDYQVKNIGKIAQAVIKAIEIDGFDISPLKKYLSKVIDEDKIIEKGKDFFVTSVKVNKRVDFEYVKIGTKRRGMAYKDIVDSASLPIFRAIKRNGVISLDGAFYDNIAITPLYDLGYEKIVLVRVNTETTAKLLPNKDRELESEVDVIIPRENLGGLFNFDKEHVNYLIKLGYLDTYRHYHRLFGNKYYFKNDDKHDERYFLNKILSLDEKTVEALSEILGVVKKKSKERTIVEVIIPEVGKLLNLDEDFTYSDFLSSIYEEKLIEQGMDRLNIYDFDKTVEAVEKTIVIDKESIEKYKDNFERFNILRAVLNKSDEDYANLNRGNIISLIINGFKESKNI